MLNSAKDTRKLSSLLVDFYFGTFARQVGHANPKVSESTSNAVVPWFLEDTLNVHCKLDPISHRISSRNRRQHRCQMQIFNI